MASLIGKIPEEGYDAHHKCRFWLKLIVNFRKSRQKVGSVMSLDTCFDALRFLARSSELEETRLMTAVLRINELLKQVKSKPAAQRALFAALNRAVKREAEIGPQDAASFWQAISQYIAFRLAALGNDGWRSKNPASTATPFLLLDAAIDWMNSRVSFVQRTQRIFVQSIFS
jgi:hypothetical protein